MSFARRGRRGRALGSRALGSVDWKAVTRHPAFRVGALTLLMFLSGYLIAAAWLFPAAENPAEARFVEVLDLRGLTAEEAASRLAERELATVEGLTLHHPDVATGTVIAQAPLPGQLARPGDAVRLTLSAGPESRTVPDLGGLAGNEAARLLRGLGFEVEIVREGVPGRPGVQATRPEAGTRLEPPARIELVVGEGALIVQVPDLRGRHVDDAGPALEEAELNLGAVSYRVDAPEAPGRVVSQSPAPGSSLRSGGFVSIVVAGTPPDSATADLAEDRPPARDTLPAPDSLVSPPSPPGEGGGA